MFSSAKYPAPVTSFPALGTGYIVSRAWHWLKGPGKRGHIVADTLFPTQMFPRLPARATFVADTKNVSDFVPKHSVSATNVSQFAQPKKHYGQQCVLVYQGLNVP